MNIAELFGFILSMAIFATIATTTDANTNFIVMQVCVRKLAAV